MQLIPDFIILEPDLLLASSDCEIILDHGLRIHPNLCRSNLLVLPNFTTPKILFLHACCGCEMNVHRRSTTLKIMTVGICGSYGIL